ncbi:MAG: hypothetical protein HQ513_01590 [Rhodospirillales bacterium]|nr:hypothetical protein [Rhodospirillales bacterium]
MYNLVKSLYRLLPEKVKEILRPCIPKLLPIISKKERTRLRWIRAIYTPFHRGQRNELLLSAVRFCNANRPVEGYYFEFGCYSGTTMSMAWHHSQHLFDWTYVGFDSFEGLPEIGDQDDQQIWEEGKLAIGEAEFRKIVTGHGMPNDRLLTVKGFYDKTLNAELVKKLSCKKAAAIYIDCDLYSSVVPILSFIKEFLQIGTIIIFDDWFCFHGDPIRGERRAWQEFRERNPKLRFVEFVKTCEANSFIYLGDDEDETRIDALYTKVHEE